MCYNKKYFFNLQNSMPYHKIEVNQVTQLSIKQNGYINRELSWVKPGKKLKSKSKFDLCPFM